MDTPNPTLRNHDVTQLLADLVPQLRAAAERWASDPAQSEALAGVQVICRILETVRDAVRLRPQDNTISSVTTTTVHAAAISLEQAADAARHPDLELTLRSAASRLRSDHTVER